jgi:hypothetical protein
VKKLLVVGLVLLACDQPRASAGTSGNFHEVERHEMGGLGGLAVLHDDARAVTCWAFVNAAMTCIPDWQLKEPKFEGVE